jgi:Domain of unknown function (DUF6285)
MHDVPDALSLLALARDVLVNDLLPLLPAERQFEARLVANCMAIAEREAAQPDPVEPIVPALQALSGPSADEQLLHRFACELRNGAFENSPERAAQARAILWRLTFAKLRLANPRFLAANGFS